MIKYFAKCYRSDYLQSFGLYIPCNMAFFINYKDKNIIL